MSGPDVVRIKRKRNDQAPEALLIERPGKRQHTTDVHYVLQKDASKNLFDAKNVSREVESRVGRTRGKSVHASGNGLDGATKERRTFHLKRPSTPEAGVKKRRHKDDGIATFMEKQVNKNAQDVWDLAQRERQTAPDPVVLEPTLKRPSRGAAVKGSAETPHNRTSNKTIPNKGNSQARSDAHIAAMAKSLHQFAMEEVAREAISKPKVTSQPKLPPQRSRELHRQRIAQSVDQAPVNKTGGDMDMDEEADYVYDTYVLASSSGMGATQIDTQDGVGNVGYLVITEEDEDVWGTYIEDDPSEPSDEDDENAEDWYGADYPDDDLGSDEELARKDRSEFDRYGGSDDDWEDSGTFSDDEYDRQMNPWRKKTSQQFSRYFSGIENGTEE